MQDEIVLTSETQVMKGMVDVTEIIGHYGCGDPGEWTAQWGQGGIPTCRSALACFRGLPCPMATMTTKGTSPSE